MNVKAVCGKSDKEKRLGGETDKHESQDHLKSTLPVLTHTATTESTTTKREKREREREKCL